MASWDNKRRLLSGCLVALFLCWAMTAVTGSLVRAQDEGALEAELDTGFYYTIKKGDTLWDLSHRFFDSPWVWPDLWERNQAIPNPHWIYPGQKIRLYTREGMEALAKTGRLPASVDARGEAAPHFYFYPAIDSVGFVKKAPVNPSGTIFKVQVYKEMISEGDTVFVRPENGAVFEPGQRYTVYRILKRLEEEKNRTLIGSQHYIVGLVDVVAKDGNVVTARVHRSFRHIEVDDLVMPYEARSPRIRITPTTAQLEGTIVAPEERQDLLGDHAIVFIDKGQNEGVTVGQYYTLFYQESEFFSPGKNKQEVSMPPVLTGQVLILHTEETTSTAIITSAAEPIDIGTRIRPPQTE